MAQGRNIRLLDDTSKIYVPSQDLLELSLISLVGATEITLDSVSYNVLDSGFGEYTNVHWVIIDGSPENTIVTIGSVTGGVPSGGGGGAPWSPPTNDSDAVLALETNKLGTMLQENFSDVPRTKVTALGQEVNTIYDLGKNAMVLENPSAGGGPIITSFW